MALMAVSAPLMALTPPLMISFIVLPKQRAANLHHPQWGRGACCASGKVHIFPSSHCFSGISVACLSTTCQSKHGAESYQKQHTPKLSENCLLKANRSPSVVPVCLPGRSGPELHWCYTGNGWSSGSFHLRYSRNRQPGRPSLLWQLYRLNEETEKHEVNITTATGWLTKATLQMGISEKLWVCCMEAWK